MEPSTDDDTSSVGDGIAAEPGAWSFRGPEVAAAFDRHVALSVPGYDELQRLVARLSAYFLPPGGVHVDWGCSTGRTIAEVAAANPGRGARHVGVDESAPMVERARERLAGVRAELHALPLLTCRLPPRVHLLTALYVLQFMEPADRVEALRLAASSLAEGGALVLAEKVVPGDPELVGPFQDVLWDEKADNGYTPAEVAAKARSLRGVLRPLPAHEVERSLAAAGLRATRFWQHLSFAGWLALKETK